jgi:hypothetical protein
MADFAVDIAHSRNRQLPIRTPTQTAPTQGIAEDTDESSPVKDDAISSLKQALLGNFSGEDPSIGGVSAQVALGLLGADIHLDIADLTHSIVNWEWSWGHAGETAINVAGFLPFVGVVK